jgi:FkbM family methyltransferase
MSTPTVTLPNGMKLAELNPHETKFLYDEIFVQEVYAAYGLQTPAGGLVLDIGANIGMFAYYIAEKVPDVRVWCFEPAPHCLERLRLNAARLGDACRIFPIALGDREDEVEFGYYPHYSIISGMFADEAQDMAMLRAGARTLYQQKYRREPDERELDLLVGSKLQGKQTIRCSMRRLSSILAEEKVDRVALAKIDVERAENIILAGIDAPHWGRIDQLVVEVHDQGAREHETMAAKLRELGYRTELFVEPTLKNSEIYVLVAKR